MQVILPPAVAVSKLKAGDRIRILIRAPRGLAAADLPAAIQVFDRGPAPGTVIVPVTPPASPVVDPLPDPILAP